MEHLPALRYVAAGGVIGALARWAAVSAVDDRWLSETTLGLNVAGSLLMGTFVGLRLTRSGTRRLTGNQFLLLGAGFCGSLTTLSTFAVDIARLLDDGAGLAAMWVPLTTPVAAVIAAGLGYRLGSRP